MCTSSILYNFRCAGLIASTANNSMCGVGVAFNARIGGIRMFSEDKNIDAREANSFGYGNEHVDIYSASWGPPDTGMVVAGPGELCSKQIKKGN